MSAAKTGEQVWLDLTVSDAGNLRDFYADVCGWDAQNHDMGDYADYTMHAEDGSTVAGICHARGVNAGLPPVWLHYVAVASLDDALVAVMQRGGQIIDERRPNQNGGFAVIKDPAGAHIALFQSDQDTAGG